MAEMTMVERVARAISVADLNITAKTYPEMPMERMAEHLRTVVESGHYYAMASAAIEAMREPARQLLSAGKKASCADDIYLTVVEVGGIWRAMIEAALNEEEAG